MKYKQLLDMNMVPEWRNQYLDYEGLDTALNKAVEDKDLKSREKGIDSYFELIRLNQKFSTFFQRECHFQLDKINTFHKEKLSEMKGKYKNLHDQLEQVLSSAIYREIRPNYSQGQEQDNNNLTSVSDVFKNIKRRLSRVDLNSSNTVAACQQTNIQVSASSIFGENSGLTKGREKVSSMVRKLSEGLVTSTQRITSNIGNSLTTHHQQQQPYYPVKAANNRLTPPLSEAGFTDNYYLSNSTSSLADNQHLQNLAGATSQSKEKIIASYRKKLSHLKFAFRELYFSLVLFEHYTQLNHSGFEQILRKYDRMFASTLGRNFYHEHIQTADFYNNLQAIDQLVELVEHIYTLHFENGNRRKAIEKLEVPTSIYKPTSPMLDFRVGYELGMFAVLFVVVSTIFITKETNYDWTIIFRLYQSPLYLIIFLFQTGISIAIWKHYKINHVLIFELNPRSNLSFQHFIEFGSLLGILWCISLLLFLFSEQLNIPPTLCPLALVLMILLYLLNPTATCYHKARFWLLRILGRIFTAPFNPVRFADFWVADQLVSIAPMLTNLEYITCFYGTEDFLDVSILREEQSNTCVGRTLTGLMLRTFVGALPAWFRCAQCLRRWYDENWLPLHLANAGKYGCMVLVVILSAVAQYKKTSFELDTSRTIWLMIIIYTSSLTAWWDIIYDFGLFNTYDKSDEPESSNSTRSTNGSISSVDMQDESDEGVKKKNKKSYKFLRKELVYPVWVYYFAIVEDWVLRFLWILTLSLSLALNREVGLMISLLGPLEMFRRFVWNCIRLENEQLNNCGLFRAVRDIPLEVVAPIDESHLDKVIMLMDSRDGPAMRNRLMKRRTLRPDRVSFLVLQAPDSSDSVTRRCDIRS